MSGAFRLEHKNGNLHVILTGEVTLKLIPDLRAEVYKSLAEDLPRAIYVHLEQTLFMDSSGISFLVGLRRNVMDKGKTLVLLNLHPRMRKILDLVQLGHFFQILDAEPEEAGA